MTAIRFAVVVMMWASFTVTTGIVARIAFELALIGFTFGGMIPLNP